MQVVYGDKHNVIVLVYQLDGLLCGIPVGYAHKAAELAHTMVYVYNIVADTELFQFLNGKCDLAVACAVAAQTEVVETPEKLVVGKEGSLQRVVTETLVDCVPDRRERDIIAAFLEYRLQTLCLMQVIGKQEQFVSFIDVSFEILADKVEILMEERL